jgi:hypothetical protein
MAKSDPVQHYYRELLVDPDVMANLHHSTLVYDSSDFYKRDEYYELREQLIGIINELISNKLTDRQSEVVQGIYYEQRTQMEMADKLGLCQTTIHKILKGNIDYSNGGKRYGGAEKKLKKLCKNDPEIQSIINRMKQIMLELAEY